MSQPIKFSLLVGMFLVSNIVIAQLNGNNQNTWLKYFDSGANRDEYFYDVSVFNDNYYFTGYYTDATNQTGIWVMKVNNFGDTLWTKKIRIDSLNTTFSYCINNTSDGGCLISGMSSKPYVLKLSSIGNYEFLKTYSTFTASTAVYNIYISKNKSYLLCGRRNNTGYLICIDSLGNKIWEFFNTTVLSTFYEITESDQHFYILSIENNFQSYIYKFDKKGKYIWKVLINNNISRIRFVNNTLYMMGNYVNNNILTFHLSKLDTIGNQFSFKFFNSSISKNLMSSTMLSSNRFLYNSINENIFSGDTNYCFFDILDSNMNVIRSKIIVNPGGGFDQVSTMRTYNNYIIISGGGNDSFNIQTDAIALKTDSTLNIKPVNINLTLNQIPQEIELLQNYPNPFNSETIIKFILPINEEVEIILYNIKGQIVERIINEKKTAGTHYIKFKASKLSSGVYFYSLKTDNVFITKKFLIIK